MNYFELVNKCLVELNYKQVNAFSELTKNDHKKIKNILRLLNNEICNFDNWNFKLRKTEIKLPAKTGRIKNSINGRIASIIIDGHVYKFVEDTEAFILKNNTPHAYSCFNDEILLPEFETAKTLNVVYYSANSAIDKDGKEKLHLENETDETIIPEIYAEPLLVYGTCLRLKANPQHIKFSYWLSMYNQTLANMKAKISPSACCTPFVHMHRY